MVRELGADVGMAFGNTPLHIAARRGYPDVAGVLLEQGADPDAINNDMSTALQLAGTGGHFFLLKTRTFWNVIFVNELGADVSVRNCEG